MIFYVIFNEKSKKMKNMRACVRECGGAPPVFVDDLFCKLLYYQLQYPMYILEGLFFDILISLSSINYYHPLIMIGGQMMRKISSKKK